MKNKLWIVAATVLVIALSVRVGLPAYAAPADAKGAL